MATPSNRWMNWILTSFNSIPIDGVKRVNFDNGITFLQDGADADGGPTVGIMTYQTPTFNVTTTHAMILIAVGAGIPAIFTSTLCDSKNRAIATGGAFAFTTNSLTTISARGIDGEFNQLASQTVSFACTWIDGVTNPVTVSAV